MNKLYYFVAFTTLFHFNLYADLNKDLNKFFDSFGASANVSSAAVYEGQKAGYGTGGSVTVRNRVLNSKIATIELPKVNAGCGGIDIYAGGFSFINSEKLVDNLKNIAASSVGFAFMLGIETVSPQISNQMKNLQSWANDINSMGINSCENAARLVGSVWPQNDIADQHICRTMGTRKGIDSSYVESRHQCNIEENKKFATQKVKQDFPNILYGDYNLAWKAIEQQSLLSSQNDLAELFMTITGTIIEVDRKKTFFPSRIGNELFLKVLLEGGTGTIYRCDNSKQCLVIKEDNLTISPENSWVGKVQAILIEIQNKIINDEELEEKEKALLATSSLPLYKIVNVLTSYKHGICPIDLINIADIVAMDMLLQCLKEGLEVIRNGCNQLKIQQMFVNEIEDYMNNLNRVENEIKYYETRTLRRMEHEMEIMRKMQMLEEQIAIELGF